MPASYLFQGDARQLPLAADSVQCVVTSPPYWGLRDYGIVGQIGLESTPELDVQHLIEIFREMRRVLRVAAVVPYGPNIRPSHTLYTDRGEAR